MAPETNKQKINGVRSPDVSRVTAPTVTLPSPQMANLGVYDLAKAYRAGATTPIEAVDECLAEIEAVDGRIRAFVTVFAEEARAEAVEATKRIREAIAVGSTASLPLMFGIPFALKDIIDVAGKVTTAGCAERKNHVASATAPVAQNLIDAGGICLGKVKTVEFARGGWGTNEHMVAAVNPWSTDVPLTCGGSSSGSGACVASLTVPCAVGTDTVRPVVPHFFFNRFVRRNGPHRPRE